MVTGGGWSTQHTQESKSWQFDETAGECIRCVCGALKGDRKWKTVREVKVEETREIAIPHLLEDIHRKEIPPRSTKRPGKSVVEPSLSRRTASGAWRLGFIFCLRDCNSIPAFCFKSDMGGDQNFKTKFVLATRNYSRRTTRC